MVALVGEIRWHCDQEKYQRENSRRNTNNPCQLSQVSEITCRSACGWVERGEAERMGEVSDFSKNTHLQAVVLLIAPPMSGPRTYDIAKTAASTPMYLARCSGGESSKHMIVGIEYRPAPPIPWKARKAMLESC